MTIGINIEVPQNTNKTIRSSIPLMSTHQKESKSADTRDTSTPMSSRVQFTMTKIYNQTSHLRDEWIKYWMYTQWGFSQSERMKSCHL